LAGYGFELVGADSNSALASIMRKPDEIGAVFFNEIPADFGGILKQIFEPIPKAQRPALVVATGEASMFRSSASLCYLPKPFGLGVLLETLEAVVERGPSLAKAMASGGGTAVKFLANGELLGLDEVGGCFELDFPPAIGSKVVLNNPEL